MSPFPTADQIAHAFVAAARETGSDPVMVACSRDNTKTRAYVFTALRQRFDLDISVAARLSGQPGGKAKEAFLRQARSARWFDQDLLSRVIASIPEAIPTASADLRSAAQKMNARPGRSFEWPEPARAPSGRVRSPSPAKSIVEVTRSSRPAPVMCLDPVVRRPPPARRTDLGLTAVFAGDPLPGRSALDQKRAAEAAKTGAPARC